VAAAKTIPLHVRVGVDSSTVAAMLRSKGHTVIGLTMQLWNQRRLAGHEGNARGGAQGRLAAHSRFYDALRVRGDASESPTTWLIIKNASSAMGKTVRRAVPLGRTPLPCSLWQQSLEV